MSDDDGTAKARSLPHIPLEVLQRIADFVQDVPTAQNLARTCWGLRDAGELARWHTLDLTSGWKPEGLPPVRPHPDSFYEFCAAIVEKKLRHAQAAFEAYPFRLECIKRLMLEPSDGGEDAPRAKALWVILIAAAPRLQHLTIAPLPWETNLYCSDEKVSDLSDVRFQWGQTGRTESFRLPSLTHIRFPIGHGRCFFDYWLDKCTTPNLRHLELFSPSGDYSGSYMAPPNDPQTLYHLESITIHHMEDEKTSSRCLEAQFLRAPNLQVLRLCGNWDPSRKNTALLAMGGLAKLKRVVLELPEYDVQRSQSSMDIRNFGRVPLSIEEIAVGEAYDQELQELDLDFEISRMTSLQRLTILNTPRLALNEYVDLGIGPSPEATYHIDGYFLHRLPGAPLLTTVLFLYLPKPSPSTMRRDRDEPEYFVSPYRWESEGHRGAIIRQYINPSDTKEVFTHIRILSRMMYSPDGRLYIGARRSWKDLTAYKGQVVPREVLAEVYETSGEAVAFIQGGRGLEMKAEAWQVLRDWREALGVQVDESDDGESETYSEDEEDTEDEEESDDD